MLSRLLSDAPASPFDLLEPRALLAADLMIAEHGLTTTRDAQQNVIIKLPVTVYHRGGGLYSGGGRIEYYLSADTTFGSEDYLFATTPLPRLGFAGTSGRVTLETRRPANLAPGIGQQIPEGDYHVIARIAPAIAAREANPDNNVAVTDEIVTIRYSIGSGSVGGNGSGSGNTGASPSSPLTVTLADGSAVEIRLTGPGTGQILNVDNRLTLVVSGTDNRSVLRLVPLNGSPTLGGLRVQGTIKDVLANGVNFDGDIDITGNIGFLHLGNVTNSNINVRGFSEGWTSAMGHVRDATITANFSPLRNLSLASWTDTGGTPDAIRTPYIDVLMSGGDFGASLKLSASREGFAVRQVRAGSLTSGAWNLNGGIERIDVRSIGSGWGGTIRGSVLYFNIGGNASGTLSAFNIRRIIISGSMIDANYLIGANLGDDGRLGGTGINADQFAGGRVGVFEVRGSMQNSIFASSLGTIDDVLLDDDDRLVPGQGNQIDSITVRRGMFNSFVVAPALPARASVNFRPVLTDRDPRFIDELPR